MNKIYEMKLHDTLNTQNDEVVRVAGGWIYKSFVDNGMSGYSMSTVFVPFDNEFMGGIT